MRFQSIAICTLTVLLAGGVTAQASENPTSEGSIQDPVVGDNHVETPTVTARAIEPIAAPEMQEEQQFLQVTALDSNPEARVYSSASGQNSQVASVQPVEKLEEAAVKTQLAATPRVEASKPNNTVTEVSTPASEESLRAGIEEGSVISQADALRPNEIVPQSATTNTRQLVADAAPGTEATCLAQALPTSESAGSPATNQLAQGTVRRCPRPQTIAPLAVPEVDAEFAASPALSIYIPVGYGADRNTLFLTGDYQASLREDDGSVGGGGIGIGLGNADKAVGLELSYALENGEESNFGDGALNAKLHRRLGQDLAGAVGWNGILNNGRNDFEHSRYGVITKVFRTQESLNSAFSRVAVTVGVGDGQFRSNGAVDAGENNVNVFGNVAVRVVRPVSFIAEWTGQDLALGLSIAPFKNIPFVITPAVRDLAGAGDDPRFVIGAGTALRF